MLDEVDAILARSRRSIENMERLSAMAERLANEAKKVLASMEPPEVSPEKVPAPLPCDERSQNP